MSRRRADGLAQPDLAGPLGHRDQHDVHDPDPADEQADAADRASRIVNVDDDEVAAARRSCCVWTVKSACVGSPMWCVPSRTCVASSSALPIVGWLVALMAMVLTLVRPKIRWAAADHANSCTRIPSSSRGSPMRGGYHGKPSAWRWAPSAPSGPPAHRTIERTRELGIPRIPRSTRSSSSVVIGRPVDRRCSTSKALAADEPSRPIADPRTLAAMLLPIPGMLLRQCRKTRQGFHRGPGHCHRKDLIEARYRTIPVPTSIQPMSVSTAQPIARGRTFLAPPSPKKTVLDVHGRVSAAPAGGRSASTACGGAGQPCVSAP